MSPTHRSCALAALVAVIALAAACSSDHPAPSPASAPPSGSSAPVTSSAAPTPLPRPSTSAGLAHAVYRSGIATPDPQFTPGSALSGVTAAQVCTPTWNAEHRTIKFEVQNAVSARYGVLAGSGTNTHFDQLIPASLGGDVTARNVWPQPSDGRQPGWEDKNALEVHLHQLVCRGQVTLSAAQQAIASNWPAAKRTYLAIPVATKH